MVKRAVCGLETRLNWWVKDSDQGGKSSDSRRLDGNDTTKVTWSNRLKKHIMWWK